jgi:tetratricopeptide (TPR) repeat protein
MAASQLSHAIEHYSDALAKLESSPSPSALDVLKVLLARDQIQSALRDSVPDAPSDVLGILQLDNRLKHQAERIAATVNLNDWRSSINPVAEAWWWYLSIPKQPRRLERLDWLSTALVIVFFTIALSLLVDISGRFLSGGPDAIGTFAVIAQAVLTMFAAGGILTKTGREAIEKILGSLRVPKPYWSLAKLGLATLVVVSLLLLRLSLPQIAIAYNNSGLEHYQAGRLSSAQFDYARALKLSPDYAEAHYNLGLLYEDLHDLNHAEEEYRISMSAGLDAAYNNLARLYILDKKYSAAVSLLLTGLDLAQDNEARYAMLKNLGWARLEQTRYVDAETYLDDAIVIKADRAAAHCLKAQVLEVQSEPADAQREWESCLKYADSHNPDEDAWIGLAQNNLKAGGTK